MQKNIRILNKYLFLFLIGGFIYSIIEILWRGYSHWTMVILGGICFVSIGCLNEFINWYTPLWKQALSGMVIITLLEFITGCIVNLLLKWDVWDYSDVPLNFMGQICVPFMFIWFFLSVAAIILDDYLRYWLFGEEKPKYRLFKRKLVYLKYST